MKAAATSVEPLVFHCLGSTLIGIVHRTPAEPVDVVVVVIVGGPQYRVGSHRQFVSSARSLAAAGYPVLRFDYRGMGDSDGAYCGFEHIAEDVRAAIDAVCAACKPQRGVVLLGLCDAASAALMYCDADPRVVGMILMNPWVRTVQSQAAVVVKRYYATRVLQGDFWRKLLSGEVNFAGSVASLYRNLARAMVPSAGPESTDFIGAMLLGLQRFRGRTLIVQSGRDLTADEFRALCGTHAAWRRELARDEVEVVDMARADHTFSAATDLNEFNDHCRRWLNRNFGDAACR